MTSITFTDIEVETNEPLYLDRVVQHWAAAVIEGSWNGKTCKVRCFGDPGFIKFAIDHQGYGKVVQ